MAKILDGRIVRDILREDLKRKLQMRGKKPVLAIIQVGDRADSTVYIKNKKIFGESIGVKVVVKNFDGGVAEEELVKEIEKLNRDENIDGIIIQMPLPHGISSENVINAIDVRKDADGLRTPPDPPLEQGREIQENLFVTPATGRAVEELLRFYDIKIAGAKAVVVGRSKLAGRPIADMLEGNGAQVTVCHKGTPNIPDVCRQADIIVSATGVPNLITKDYVKEGQVVIDVGINRISTSPPTPLLVKERGEENYRIVGDVNFEEVEPIVAAISPVPGGVGPLTVACLFQNLLDLSVL